MNNNNTLLFRQETDSSKQNKTKQKQKERDLTKIKGNSSICYAELNETKEISNLPECHNHQTMYSIPIYQINGTIKLTNTA